MQKIFIKYLSCVVMVALFAMLVLGWGMQSRNMQKGMADKSKIKLSQLAHTLENNQSELNNLMFSLSEDYLTRARAFAYIIQQNNRVLESQEELERIKRLLNVDELHVINEDGVLFAGTVSKYFGMDFRSTKQTAEFLRILDNPDAYLVQPIQPNGAEQKLFQYVGVARKDKPGIVQIGLAPKRALEARERNSLPRIFNQLTVEKGACTFAIDADTGIILAHTDAGMEGKPASDMGFTEDYVKRFQNGGFLENQGHKIYYYLTRSGDMILGNGITYSALYAGRAEQMKLMFFYFLGVSLVLIAAINNLLKKQIVNGVHEIGAKLTDITNGKMDTVVEVDYNPEFKELSMGINRMVSSILNATVRVSRVMDLVDLPIGIFEYRDGMDKILATERLQAIFMWSEEEARGYYQDKDLFLEKLDQICSKAFAVEERAYQISTDPERWIEIHSASDENGAFGAVMDVTKEMVEKRRIRHERDYDSLTGLCKIDRFKAKASMFLEHPDLLDTAAVIMLDLDCFKGINDRYGHDWGDYYLRTAAGFLAEFDGEHGIAGRRSGDEFCLFLYGYGNREQIVKRMEKFYEDLARREIVFPDSTRGRIRISSGLAWFGGELKDYDSLMKAADQALYDSKNYRKGSLSLYTGNRHAAQVRTGK